MQNNNLKIRNTILDDLPRVLEIYEIARKYMKEHGNPNQWGDKWPSQEIILEDIEKKISYVIYDEDKIYGVFALIYGVDQTYLKIWDGAWKSDKEYGTIHRLASSQEVKGIATTAIKYALKASKNLRIDTHEDNIAMQKATLKNGFVYCGKIICIEGGERLAYELVVNK